MPIIQKNFRNNGAGEFLLSQFEATPLDALQALCVYELGFGGNIAEATPTFVDVRTRVLDCRDRTTFEGNEEDMRKLSVAAATAAFLSQEHRAEIVECAARRADALPEGVRGVPLYIATLSPFMLGFAPATVALLSAAKGSLQKEFSEYSKVGLMALMCALRLQADQALDFDDAFDKVAALIRAGLREADLREVVQLSRETGEPFAAVLDSLTRA